MNRGSRDAKTAQSWGLESNRNLFVSRRDVCCGRFERIRMLP